VNVSEGSEGVHPGVFVRVASKGLTAEDAVRVADKGVTKGGSLRGSKVSLIEIRGPVAPRGIWMSSKGWELGEGQFVSV
jgi:hypothetical protein